MKLAQELNSICEDIWYPKQSLDIPRSEMPQVNFDKLNHFLRYLKRNGCDYERCEKNTDMLKPSQNELDTDKANNIWKDEKAFENPIITSKDGFVLDGHHRWLAVKLNSPETSLKCIQLDRDALYCINLMHGFKHSEKLDINDNEVE